MAQIEMEPGIYMGAPRCSGCGERFLDWVPAGLDSRTRGPAFSADYRKLGSKAREIAAFAEAHRSCPEPRREMTDSGIVVIDRRWQGCP